MNITKKDFLAASVAGFLTGLLMIPTLKNVKIVAFGYLALGLIIGLPFLWALALVVGRFLSHWLGFIQQFVKFIIVGFLNTAIDFGVLNLLSLYTGLTSGLIIGGVNVPGFIIAATNSYFWNKFWVFSQKRQPGEKVSYSDFLTFIAVVAIGAVLNGGIVVCLTTYVSPLFGLSPERWLNISKAFATVFNLVFNFLGLKFFVFKKKEENPSEQKFN